MVYFLIAGHIICMYVSSLSVRLIWESEPITLLQYCGVVFTMYICTDM